MGIIWLPWDFLEKTGIEKFLCLQHSFPPFCRYLEIIPNFLLFDWALGFIHTKYYRCHYTSSTLNFKNIERGVKLLTGRNTRCLLCSSTSCLCSTWNGKVLRTGYIVCERKTNFKFIPSAFTFFLYSSTSSTRSGTILLTSLSAYFLKSLSQN